MSKTMVAEKPISVIHHEDKTYMPDRRGEFGIEDRHVDAMRTHGLILKSEAEERAARAASDSDKDKEIAKLKARLADLEGDGGGKKK
jgi:hypothetical protein